MDREIRNLSTRAAALGRWHPGTRAEQLAKLTLMEAQARLHQREADELNEKIAAGLAALNTDTNSLPAEGGTE
jgi:hypothetical protein